MRFLTLTCIFFLHIEVFSQQLCIPIDSITVYSLPGYLKTNISLDDFAVREWNDPFINKFTKTIIDDTLILKLTEIDLTKQDNLFKSSDLDVRCVIDVFLGEQIITISLSYMSNYIVKYKYLGKCYYLSPEFRKWLKDIGIE